MPILANTIIATLEDDADRYTDMLIASTVSDVLEHDGAVYDVYSSLSDKEIPGLEDCSLMVLTDSDNTIVYSCYYKLVGTRVFGKRIVQVEVRCSVPGLARAVMERLVQKGLTLRTDISNTPAGRKMWERFIQQSGFNFYLAELTIDLRAPQGFINQDANQPEIYKNLRRLSPDEEVWHPNRKSGYVTVVYATKEKLL